MTVQACAVVRCTASHLLVERDARSRIGLRSGLAQRKISATTESFFALDGRSGLHSRTKSMSDTNRDFLSDFANLRLDPTATEHY
jgi:hypothetical protein